MPSMMRAEEKGQLTQIKPGPRPDPGPAQRLLFLVFPAIAVGTFAAVLAAGAAILGWYREQMLLLAGGIGILLAFPTVYLVYRQRSEREAASRALASVQAHLAGIIDSAMDAVITVDESQHVVLFNAAAEEVFRCPKEEAIGAPLSRFIPERFRGAHAGQVKHFGETGASSRRMGRGARVVTGLRRTGEEFPIDASISQIVENGQRFFTVILRDVTERVEAEEALRRSREEIQELALMASTAREQEKSRIARELHDELGQALTALKIDVGWLRETLQGTDPGFLAWGPSPVSKGARVDEVVGKLNAMQGLLDGTVAAARRISADLRPLMLDDLGLTAAAEWLVHNFTDRTGIACELVLGGGDLDLPDPYATAVFRVLQECLTNAAKHAQASQVEVTLEREGGDVQLTVRDNGKGFPMDVPRKPGSFGLVGLRERATLLQGQAKVSSEPGKGTTVELRIPVREREALP